MFAILDCAPVLDGYPETSPTPSVWGDPRTQRRRTSCPSSRTAPEQLADPRRRATVFAWWTARSGLPGENAVNGYVGHVMGHRVYRHGSSSTVPLLPAGQDLGYMATGTARASCLKPSCLVFPERARPLHHGRRPALGIEPHLGSASSAASRGMSSSDEGPCVPGTTPASSAFTIQPMNPENHVAAERNLRSGP